MFSLCDDVDVCTYVLDDYLATPKHTPAQYERVGQTSTTKNTLFTRHGFGFQPKGRKDLSTPDSWRLKRKTQEFCGVPARFGLGTPKCIDFATCFRLSRSVYQA